MRRKLAFILMVPVIFLFFTVSIHADQVQPEFTFNLTYRSPQGVVARPDVYDFQASAIKEDDGLIKVWQCGQEARDIGSDAIIYSKHNSNLTVISSPRPVLRVNRSNELAFDHRHACAPSVVKHSNPNVDIDGPNGPEPAGQELYLMYYECAGLLYNNCDGSPESTNNGKVSRCDSGLFVDSFARTCLAASKDGKNWAKYSDKLWNQSYRHYGDANTAPTPVIGLSDGIINNCGYFIDQDGKGRAYLHNEKCTVLMANGQYGMKGDNYGSGQPHAWTKVYPDGTKQIWLYYQDTHGSWNNRKIYLTKSWDGFHFEDPIVTNLNMASDVKYYNSPVNGHGGVWVGAFTIGKNYFGYSYDGINWIFPNYDAAWWQAGGNAQEILKIIAPFKIGMAKPNELCMTPGPPGIVADKYGNLKSLSELIILSGEGKSGSYALGQPQGCFDQREKDHIGSTWDIFAVKGNLISTQIPIALGDINSDGVVDIQDYILLSNAFGTNDQNADLNNDGIVDIQDYIVLSNNFGKTS